MIPHIVDFLVGPNSDSRFVAYAPNLVHFTDPDFRGYFFFRFSTQPSMFRCLPALTARAPGGTSSLRVVPVPT